MRMLKVLDAKGTVLLSDALNQLIIQKLVASPASASKLSRELNIPTLKLWRRIKRLQKAKLLEVTNVEKVGNLDKKLYRETALRYDVPQQFFKPKLNDRNVKAAFEIYIGIQNETNTALATFDHAIPKNGDPMDFALYAHMQAFVQIFEDPETRAKVQDMKQLLSKYLPSTCA